MLVCPETGEKMVDDVAPKPKGTFLSMLTSHRIGGFLATAVMALGSSNAAAAGGGSDRSRLQCLLQSLIVTKRSKRKQVLASFYNHGS